MNKNMIKSIAVLACIAVVCTALLAVINVFWKVESVDSSNQILIDMVGDDTVTTISEVNTSSLPEDRNVGKIYRVVDGDSAGVHIVVGKSKVSGNVEVYEMFVCIEKDASVVRSVAIDADNPDKLKASAGGYRDPLKKLDAFKGKDPNTMPFDDIKVSGATETATGLSNAVKAAFNYYKQNKAAVDAAPLGESVEVPPNPMLDMAKDMFGDDASEIEEPTDDTAKKIKTYKVTMSDDSVNYIYCAYGRVYTFSDGDEVQAGVIDMYLGYNPLTNKFAGLSAVFSGNDAWSVKGPFLEQYVDIIAGEVVLGTPSSTPTTRYSDAAVIEAINYIYTNMIAGGNA